MSYLPGEPLVAPAWSLNWRTRKWQRQPIWLLPLLHILPHFKYKHLLVPLLCMFIYVTVEMQKYHSITLLVIYCNVKTETGLSVSQSLGVGFKGRNSAVSECGRMVGEQLEGDPRGELTPSIRVRSPIYKLSNDSFEEHVFEWVVKIDDK